MGGVQELIANPVTNIENNKMALTSLPYERERVRHANTVCSSSKYKVYLHVKALVYLLCSCTLCIQE